MILSVNVVNIPYVCPTSVACETYIVAKSPALVGVILQLRNQYTT